LFLVVGPSGAGKDTLIAAARDRLSATHVFPRRSITRATLVSAEDHVSETEASFAQKESSGGFALSWHAHGLRYGIPASISDQLKLGRHVVANVSRDVVEDARKRHTPCKVILVTARPELLAARLRDRAREAEVDITDRLSRSRNIIPDVTIANDGDLASACDEFMAALKG
jgi:phosphonate metabolism protein PhnN/1,5-bisphosphokinase (PRPP-forming)